jgi:subtilisin family serine protease
MVRLLATLVAAAATTIPTDPLADVTSFQTAGLPAAWSVTTGSPDVVIGVMDSGVDAAHPDLAAPACFTTTQVGGGFGPGCGTSGSTPVVAGIVALMRAQAPFASAQQIEDALERTAEPVDGVRFGRVDAYAALRELGTPAPRLRPTIDGHAYVGATLEALSGIWVGAGVELAYRWERCRTQACRPVATTQTYRLRKADRGRRLRVVVTAPQHGLTAMSARTDVVR